MPRRLLEESTTRRVFLRRAGLGSALASANLFAQRRRPNVLFLSVDDMNDYGFFHTMPGVKVPYLDKFRASATTFERAYCASPACVPSRAAIFSGLYPHTTGSYLNGSDPWTKAPLDTTESMPETFQKSGYITFGRGKQFHAPLDPGREKAMWTNEFWGGGFGPFPPEKDQVGHRFWGWTPWEAPDSDFPDVKNCDAAIDFLGQNHSAPFFLALGLWRPHTPFTAPKRFFDMYDLASIEIPPGYRDGDLDDTNPRARELAQVWGERFVSTGKGNPKQWREFVRAYLATTSFADWSIGRVLEKLDSGPYRDNTIVVFWSDNGYHCGEKDHWEKTTLWEKSALTPAAIRRPGDPAGRVSKRTIGLIDLYPTLVDLCGLKPPPQQLQGRSLRPLLDRPAAAWNHPALTTYGEHHSSVRDERYRYIRYPDGSEELYDHNADKHEWTNLAANPKLAPVKHRLSGYIPKDWAPSLGGRLG
jgi:arylsulfatase A-like enzyme